MTLRVGWIKQARCRGMDNTVFFSDSPKAQAEAKAICAECPVARQCLDWALEHTERGTWGGHTEWAREVFLRNQRKLAS
jgi:WhiB family redox-sensing transcriptional regulator